MDLLCFPWQPQSEQCLQGPGERLRITGFPRGIERIEKVLKFKIVFQDLEKVMNLAKMYIRYW